MYNKEHTLTCKYSNELVRMVKRFNVNIFSVEGYSLYCKQCIVLEIKTKI